MEDNIMVPSRRTQQNWLPAFFNDFFDDDFRHFGNMMRTSSPAINVKESDKEYTVEIAAPGMSKDDFKIRINEENELVVTLEHKDEKKEEKKDEKYLRREFSYSLRTGPASSRRHQEGRNQRKHGARCAEHHPAQEHRDPCHS